MKPFVGGLIISLSAGLLPAQQTWIVDLFNRPGAHFTDLPQAVAAASPGDTLRLRATTSSLLDVYTAPTIQGKGLTIVGETQPVRAMVAGGWIIQGVPAGQALTMTGVKMTGTQQVSTYLACSSCTGAVVLDDIVVDSFATLGFYGGFTDCNLVTISRSTIEWRTFWPVLRSNLMLSDSSIRSVSFAFASGPALRLEQTKLTLARSSLYGSSAYSTAFPYTQSPAIQTCASEIKIGGGCTLSAGHDLSGNIQNSVVSQTNCVTGPGLPSTIVVDFATTQAIGGWSGEPNLIYVSGPQTGLAYSLTPTTLHVDQYTHAGALTALAIGGVTTMPWTYLVGPVFVDPVGFTDYLDFAPTNAVLRRSFALPPGLPPGANVTMQAFELLPNGQYLTSNATIAGIW